MDSERNGGLIGFIMTRAFIIHLIFRPQTIVSPEILLRSSTLVVVSGRTLFSSRLV